MNIAELFVNLGIKGADKTIGALDSVGKGLKGIGSTSIETKAALLGAMYGLERMMAISGAMGTGLTNFTALTGLSAQSLQKWQFAARQAGVSSEELTGSLKGVQNSMANMLMGKGAPEGIALVSKAVGGLDPTRYRDTFYMMTQLQKAMQSMSVEQGNIAGKSFGLSEGVIAGMRRNVFTPEMFAKAPTYSNGEIGQLDKSNVAWSNLNNKIQMAFGHFNAKHGVSMVNDISKIVDQVFHLAEAFEKLATKLKLFDVIDEIFKGWGMIFDTIGVSVDKLMEMAGHGKDTKDSAFDKKGNLKKNPIAMMRDKVGEIMDDISWNDDVTHGRPTVSPSIAPNIVSRPQPVQVTTHHNHHKIDIHNVDVKDNHAAKANVGAGLNNAYRQRSAQRQGT